MNKKKPLYKIKENSIVKGTGAGSGYYVCETIPPHPRTMYPQDRKRGYIYLHEVIMENKLGRPINVKKYEVHHKDGDTFNNEPSNLTLRPKGIHQREHSHKTKFWKKSPENKPKAATVQRVIQAYLSR